MSYLRNGVDPISKARRNDDSRVGARGETTAARVSELHAAALVGSRRSHTVVRPARRGSLVATVPWAPPPTRTSPLTLSHGPAARLDSSSSAWSTEHTAYQLASPASARSCHLHRTKLLARGVAIGKPCKQRRLLLLVNGQVFPGSRPREPHRPRSSVSSWPEND